MERCGWVTQDPLYIAYHDQEWGVPETDGKKLFEMICLEGQQAGLSWITVLKKRENYRACFHQFDPVRVAAMQEEDVERLVQNAGIIRHRGKIQAIIGNARAYLQTLSNCVKWFPERKGLISAFAIGSYGLGSLGFKFIDTQLLETVGLEKTFVIWGAIALVMIVFGATLMKDAPKQEVKTSNGVVEKDYTLAQSMRKPQYWMLAVMFLTACMSGLYVIGVAKDIAQSLAHLDAISAANAVTVISIANLSGRLVLGILSDKISRIRVITIGQVISLVGMAALLFAPLNAVTFFAAIACVAFNFGGTITVFPSLVSEFFGLNNLAKNYGVIYLGFGIGSICGSIIASLFGGFYVTFCVIFALLILSLALSTTIRQPEQKVLREIHI